MKLPLRFAATVAFTPVLMSASCNKAVQCNNAVCTEMFAMITAEVHDLQEQSVMLDEVYTTRKKTGEQIRLQQQLQSGTYVILDDSYVKKMFNSRETFIFTGLKNGVTVVEDTFVISADCCHIKKESGREVLVIER